jgi:3',5'-cyclic-AMP phosphodiesterase
VGAGLALPGSLIAAGRRVDEHSWALLSDTHLDADRELISHDVNMVANFEAAAAAVCAHKRLPAAALICGDLAFTTGESGDYTTVEQLLRPMRAAGMPLYLTLGNHDNRDNFWAALTEAKAAMRPVTDHQTALVHSPRANWFILDSLEKTNSTPGLLGNEQCSWLARALDANNDKPALIVAHHNLYLTGDPQNGMKDSDRLLEIIRPRKQVKAYIFGHTHDWGIWPDQSGIHLVNLPPTAYVFTKGRPSGWVHASLERHGARLQLHSLDPHHPQAGQVAELKWRNG